MEKINSTYILVIAFVVLSLAEVVVWRVCTWGF